MVDSVTVDLSISTSTGTVAMLHPRSHYRPARPFSGQRSNLGRSKNHNQRPQPRVELLETRDLPAVFSPAHLLSHPSNMAPRATSGPTGYSPTQIRHAYGFAQI